MNTQPPCLVLTRMSSTGASVSQRNDSGMIVDEGNHGREASARMNPPNHAATPSWNSKPPAAAAPPALAAPSDINGCIASAEEDLLEGPITEYLNGCSKSRMKFPFVDTIAIAVCRQGGGNLCVANY